MKKAIIAISAAFIVSLSLSSCCKTCSHTTLGSITVCEKDYSTTTEYNNAITAYEIAGYQCK